MAFSDELQMIRECGLVDIIDGIEDKNVNIGEVVKFVKWLIEQAEKVERYEEEIKLLNAFKFQAVSIMTEKQLQKVVDKVRKVL